jgi:hypothetical protein
LAAGVMSAAVAMRSARTAMVATAGSSPAKAQNIGTLSDTVAYRGSLTPASTSQYFKFSLVDLEKVGLSLTGLSANADLQLARDTNGDGRIESNEIIATSAHPGTTNESIGKTLGKGTYYARVYEYAGSAQYTLTLSASSATVKNAGGGLHIVFNYSHDTTGFFASHPAAKTLLDQAATAFEAFTNTLTAITPGNGNSWSETFDDPSGSGSRITIDNPSVGSNTLVIYVGASSHLQTSELGVGEPGGWNAMGSLAWINTVTARGQAGALRSTPTAFSPWGGSISFSSTTNWNLSTANPSAGQNDFLSVATHEIAHVLGFGTSDVWKSDVSGNNFIGHHAEAANHGQPVPLAAGLAHWANNFTSTVNGVSQFCEMDPFLITGTRRAFTLLDYAGLEDVGWTV